MEGKTRFRHRGERHALPPPDREVRQGEWSDKEKTWKTGMKKVLHMGWYIHDTHVAERFYLVHKEEAFRKRLN